MSSLFKNAARIHLDHAMHRYLMSNAEGRWDGYEKATCHIELCKFYVGAAFGLSLDNARMHHEDEYNEVHDATQALTDDLESIGFPLTGRPDYDKLVPLFFDEFHRLACKALKIEE